MSQLILDGRAPTASDLDWLLASRALAFGEGVFTTLRVFAGQAVFLEAHLRRLQTGLEILLCPLDIFDWVQLQEEIQQLSQQLGAGRLKVMLLAGCGTAGYRRDAQQSWHRLIQASSLQIQSQAYTGIAAWWQPSLGEASVAAGKHLNRLSQVLATAGCPSHFLEAIHFNAQGFIAEGLARNIFWYAQGQWHTPALTTGALAGVMRQQLMQHLAASKPVLEVEAKLASLQAAEEVFLCNSLQGIWPVTSLEAKQGAIAKWSLGSQTQQLMQFWHPRLGLPV